MAFLNRKKKVNKANVEIKKQNIEKVSVKNVFVCKAIIISSYCGEGDLGPSYVTWYFLAQESEGKLYELFSGIKLEKEENTHEENIDSKNFDTPYVERVEPLKNYLKKNSAKEIDIQLLFQFITNMNVQNVLGAFDDEDQALS